MSVAVKPIARRELLAYQADVKGSIFRQIREVLARFKERGFTQKELAAKIGMDAGQLSRRLRGDYDLQLETLSDLARGLECRIDVKLTPINQLLNANYEEPREETKRTAPSSRAAASHNSWQGSATLQGRLGSIGASSAAANTNISMTPRPPLAGGSGLSGSSAEGVAA
jgi:transcriptional regulator with XRE-family HTH domain